MAAWRITGEKPQRLADAVSLPDGCAQLWRSFLDLHSCRGSSGFGPSPIGYVDMDAYQRMTGMPFAPWEVTAIRRADAAYMAVKK